MKVFIHFQVLTQWQCNSIWVGFLIPVSRTATPAVSTTLYSLSDLELKVRKVISFTFSVAELC